MRFSPWFQDSRLAVEIAQAQTTPTIIDMFRELIDYGFPVVVLAFIGWAMHRYFLGPLGGPDGIVATFFVTQTECLRKQTQLLEQHNQVADRIQASIGALQVSHTAHANESTEFHSQTKVELHDLIYWQGRLATALALEVQNDEARRILVDIADRVRKYCPPPTDTVLWQQDKLPE